MSPHNNFTFSGGFTDGVVPQLANRIMKGTVAVICFVVMISPVADQLLWPVSHVSTIRLGWNHLDALGHDLVVSLHRVLLLALAWIASSS